MSLGVICIVSIGLAACQVRRGWVYISVVPGELWTEST